MPTVILFHRDLRIVDHNGLESIPENEPIIPLFVFTPEQATVKNTLRSPNAIQFMIDSIRDLESAIRHQGGKLYVAFGDTITVLEKLYKTHGFEKLVETVDYTPYAKRRTETIAEFCEKFSISYNQVQDSYLTEPGSIKTKTGKTFQKFTPFYESARHTRIPKPAADRRFKWYKILVGGSGKTRKTRKIKRHSWETSLDVMEKRLVPKRNIEVARGGRKVALELLTNLPKKYAETHNIPSIPTTLLSAHNHFGTVSIREVYHAATGQPELQRQLWWRDFYGHIMADFETLYGMSAYEFQRTEFERPLSEKKQEWLIKWEKGETGIPLLDAGMKQLLRTGWMHNRVRLVVGSWLTKDMGIHWRHGERFFARHLVDYDPAQNMMNWIWVSSALPFASAPFRKVTAERTAKHFDPDGEYVRKWL